MYKSITSILLFVELLSLVTIFWSERSTVLASLANLLEEGIGCSSLWALDESLKLKKNISYVDGTLMTRY